MVLQKRLDYGFNGYQVPSTPRAARSARKRRSFRKVDDNPLCAFDLLATVAGKLLKVEHDEANLLKVEPCIVNHSSKEFQNAHNDACSGHASVITTSDCSEKIVLAGKLVDDKSEAELGTFGNKVKVGSFNLSCDCTVEDDNTKQIKIEPPNTGKVGISVDDSVKLQLYSDHISCSSFPVSREDVKLGSRDDDENSSRCTQPRTTTKAFRLPPRIGDRRIRKLLAFKYWKGAPKLKDEEHFKTETEIKSVYGNRRKCYRRQRSQRDYPFKKRKLYHRSSVSNFDGGISSEGIFGNGFCGDSSASGATKHDARGMPAPVTGQHTSLQSSDDHVKLRIKSFKVPELFIDIPETETVGFLKRSVMEAVTAILGGGLHIGVLFQGKKIRDDNRILKQSGIFHDNNVDALGFILEPSSSQTPPPLCPEDHPFLLPCDAPQPLTRWAPAPSVVQEESSDVLLDPRAINLGNIVESDHDSAPFPPDTSVDISMTDSRGLVSVLDMNVEALSVVPMRKSKRSEVVQRRIRRPFSVLEVEALVQAVEKLGTGRWRDVKLRAFNNAKHRTYVDLKDKWKTLVHTARISPQQRRGEPVPQELLDRVLAAHTDWSHQSETCLLL